MLLTIVFIIGLIIFLACLSEGLYQGAIVGILIILLTIIPKFFVSIPGYSEGHRIVTLEKISKKGIIFKTYEGIGVLGVGSSDGEMVRKLWHFSIDSQETVNQLDTLNGKVKLYYKENFLTAYRDGSTNYIVYKGEKVR